MSDLDSLLYQSGENSIIMYMNGGYFQGGGGQVPPPPLNETLKAATFTPVHGRLLGSGRLPSILRSIHGCTCTMSCRIIMNIHVRVQCTHYNYAVSVIELEDSK